MAALVTRICCVLLGLMATTLPSAAQSVADFYRNRTITVIVITAPGGTYDLYGRLVSRHLPRFLPGEPKGAVQYVPGANGVVGHLRLYNLSPKDGTEFALVSQDIAINQALYPDVAKFDARRLQWIGRLSTYTGVMVIATRTGVTTAADLRRIQVIAGAWGTTGQSMVVPALLNSLAGTRFKVVPGYRGAAAAEIALERGEVDAISASWTSLKARKHQWLADKVVMVPFQLSMRRHPDLADLPQIRDLALTPEGRRILEYVESDTGIGFSLAAPPAVPDDRIAALRTAYARMIVDPEFLAEAKARRLKLWQAIIRSSSRSSSTPCRSRPTTCKRFAPLSAPPRRPDQPTRQQGEFPVLIDWHTHVHHPDDQAKARWLGKCPMNIEDVIKCHERAQLDISVISNAVHYIRLMEDREIAVHLRASNEYLAKCRDKYKDKVVAMATSVPNGGEENLRELERAVKENDLRAVIINASHKGEYPDADGAKPFWKLVTDLDIPVFLHPGWCGDSPAMQEYRLNSSVGRPADNCLSIARIIVRGILEQFPTLKLVGSHLGGGICETIGRLDYAYDLIEESWFLGPYEPMYIKHAPSHYLKMLYLDSACYATPAAKMALETVGPDQFLFGSDSPPMIPLKDKAMQMMKDMNMPPDVYAKVMGGNAARLLKLH